MKDHKVKNKTVKVFSNLANPSRCVIQLYKKYMDLRPENAPPDIFYLQPLQKPVPGCWYHPRPVGHNVLSRTVKKLTDKVGAQGHYTNHSLRRTCATRLFQEGVDEQQIMAVTGHRSADGVRVYKEVSHTQQEEMSKIIQSSKSTRMEENVSELCEEEKEPKRIKNDLTNMNNQFNFSGCSVTFNYH